MKLRDNQALLREVSDLVWGAKNPRIGVGAVTTAQDILDAVDRHLTQADPAGTPVGPKETACARCGFPLSPCHQGPATTLPATPQAGHRGTTGEDEVVRISEMTRRSMRHTASVRPLDERAPLPPDSTAPDCWCVASMPVHPDCPRHGIAAYADRAAPPGSAVAGAPRPVLPWPTLLEDLDEAADWWQECGRHSDAARLRRRATLIRTRFENWEIAKSSRLPLGPGSAHAMLVVTAVNEEDPRAPAAPPDSAAAPRCTNCKKAIPSTNAEPFCSNYCAESWSAKPKSLAPDSAAKGPTK